MKHRMAETEANELLRIFNDLADKLNVLYPLGAGNNANAENAVIMMGRRGDILNALANGEWGTRVIGSIAEWYKIDIYPLCEYCADATEFPGVLCARHKALMKLYMQQGDKHLPFEEFADHYDAS